MSCFMCSNNLMFDITRAIKSGQLDGFMNDAEKDYFKGFSHDELFKKIYALNVQSVNSRYKEDSDEEPTESYREVNSGSIEQVSENICCLLYQSSEVPETGERTLFEMLRHVGLRLPRGTTDQVKWDWE